VIERQLHRLSLLFATAFLLVALTSGYWAYARRETLIARPDNPRRVLAERYIRRGTIYDRNGQRLAESVGQAGDFERHYPYPDLAPVLGYVSAFYGSAGIEAAADPVLHGDAEADHVSLWDSLIGRQPPGRDVRLSIDLRLQMTADDAFGDQIGAAILLDTTTGEILALASHPTYDPNTLDENWDTFVSDPRAPLLNRATFALYQPGGALAPAVLAGILRAGLADLDMVFQSGTEEIGVGNLELGCRIKMNSSPVTLGEAFESGCPWPFADLGGQLGAHALDQLFRDFRLYEAHPISIPTSASAQPNLTAEAPIAAIGQGSLNISPLHLALVTAALAQHGEMPAPRLLTEVQTPGGDWQPVETNVHPIAAIAPEYADEVKRLMTNGHSAVALTSAGGKTLAWFSGFAPFEGARYAVAVLLESGDSEEAARIGRELLKKAESLSE
jgi:penicillin-binding protein A